MPARVNFTDAGVAFDADGALAPAAQLVAKLRLAIDAGAIPEGATLPSIRTGAAELGVHSNTLRKVYAALEAQDPIERQSCRPDFNVLVYPGWRKADTDKVPVNAPPAFLACAGLDDASHAKASVAFYNFLFDAKIPVELHIYSHGKHAGGIHPRNGIPFGTWHIRFEEWLTDLGMMKKSNPA